jgi:hypothetical protein
MVTVVEQSDAWDVTGSINFGNPFLLLSVGLCASLPILGCVGFLLAAAIAPVFLYALANADGWEQQVFLFLQNNFGTEDSQTATAVSEQV